MTVPPFVLTDLDGRARRSDELLGGGPRLLVFVEHECPTSVATLRAIGSTSASVVVISEGPLEAARDLRARTGLDDRVPVLVETAPYPVSTAYGLRTVPTLVLVDASREEVDRCEGLDRPVVSSMLQECGADVAALDADLPPSKPGCQSRNTYDAATQAALEAEDAAAGADDGTEEMWRRGWTDGLPVVPPTPERVATMLGGRDGAHELGAVPPKMGLLTLERLAACAVLAGCEPDHFPVVVAGAQALLDPAFNLHGVQNTTHFAAPLLIVNGPVAAEIGMNSGSNALGFGTRANATIGRALRLMMCLTGGGTPGGLDQSTLGGPHKFTFCLAENEGASSWVPLHVERGLDPGTSAVTAVCGEAPAGVSDHYSATPEELASTLTLAMERVWSPAWYPVAAETVLIVCPEHARTFADAGWSKDDLRRWIFTRARRTVADLRDTGSGELTPEVEAADVATTEVPKFTAPEEIVLVVAGGEAGRFSAVVGPWVGYERGSRSVTRTVDLP